MDIKDKIKLISKTCRDLGPDMRKEKLEFRASKSWHALTRKPKARQGAAPMRRST